MSASESVARRATYPVELFGVGRTLTGLKRAQVELGPGATLRDLLAELARCQPALVGPVVRPDGQGLVEGHVFNLNGRSFASDLQTALAPGDSVLLLYSVSGG